MLIIKDNEEEEDVVSLGKDGKNAILRINGIIILTIKPNGDARFWKEGKMNVIPYRWKP